MAGTTGAEVIGKHIRAPLAVISGLFEEYQEQSSDSFDGSEFGKIVQDHFMKALDKPELLDKIPVFAENSNRPARLKEGSLVRFRCMVQDPSYGEELHLSVAHVINSATGSTERKFSQYTDAEHILEEGWEIDYTAPANVFTEKEVAYCVSVPGQTQWARQTADGALDLDLESLAISGPVGGSSEAAIKTAEAKYPLRGVRHAAALVKFYMPSTAPKVSSIIDVVGIYELAYNAKEESANEDSARWPCVHSIFYKPVSTDSLVPGLAAPTTTELAERYSMLLARLTSVLGGDDLAAHYLLLHLLSSTVNIQGSKVGKFSLNLIGFPSGLQTEEHGHSGFTLTNPAPKRVSDALAQFVPRSVELPFDLKLLNGTAFVPNAESGDLQAGALQLAGGTEVVCDETSLHEGTLDQKGVRNLHALQTVILDQAVAYQYPFQPIEMDTNLRVLVLSTGKSILQNDCDLYLADPAASFLADVQQGKETPMQPLDPMHTEQIRQYLELTRDLEFSIPKDVSDAISDEYASSRRRAHADGGKMMTQAELGLTITVARLVSISKGEKELSLASWKQASDLERRRAERNERARAKHSGNGGSSSASDPDAQPAERKQSSSKEPDTKASGEPAR
ncbi:hypothetical protein GGI12_002127 [Dipsacomyces acuminosporus]|nr:hypothetical protein GGI12_002127 [Dipsacomyces acuminosporus]